MTFSLQPLLERGVLGLLDVHFAQAMCRLAGESSAEVTLGAAFASRAVQRGHVCADLPRLCSEPLLDADDEVVRDVSLPPPQAWLRALSHSSLVRLGLPGPGGDEPRRPLVLDGAGRLFLYRYADYQERLARRIRQAVDCRQPLCRPALASSLGRLFGAGGPGGGAAVDGQRLAALMSVRRGLTVISGGPGTGKTTTVVKILVLLQEQALALGRSPLRILLLAPTGKAARRLGEAISGGIGRVAAQPGVAETIPREAATIHRALGYMTHAPTRFVHDRQNPLPADVVLVDEASMVDLALMTKLTDAVLPAGRIILLGDKDQLASVEAGAILGDIYNVDGDHRSSPELAEMVASLTGEQLAVRPPATTAAQRGAPVGQVPRRPDELPGEPYEPADGAPAAPPTSEAAAPPTSEAAAPAPAAPGAVIADCMVHLEQSYRFDSHSGIAALARAVNAGDGDAAVAILQDRAGLPYGEVMRRPLPARGDLAPALAPVVKDGFAPLFARRAPEDKLAALERFRILCAHRRGRYGVEGVNEVVEQCLRAAGLLRQDQPDSPHYDGRLIIITRNDYQLELYNGDAGIIARADDGRLMAFFPPAATEPEAVPRRLLPARLPPHETAYAMTIHKSQGSELDRVAVLLPEQLSPILTRELLYTGLSRARSRIDLYCSEAVLRAAISRRIERASGLREALWGAGSRPPTSAD